MRVESARTILRPPIEDKDYWSNAVAPATHLAERARIVALVPRGEVIRNFVYSGTFDEVAKESDLTILSVTPNDDLQRMLQSRYQQVFELPEVREKWVVNMQREILDMAHGRWLWSEGARERWRLRDKEARTARTKLKRLVKKLACYPFANRKGLRLLSKMERASSYYLRTTEEYVRLFEELKPSLVFNGSHVHSSVATQAIQAAQWLNIPTATFIFSWDNLTSQGRIMFPYDYYLVWSDAIRQQLLQIYENIEPEQVFVTGTPQFDFYFNEEYFWTREKFCDHVGADPARPIVLYSTGMANHVLGEPKVVESLATMLREMSDLGPPQLLVREYAKGPGGTFDDLKRRCPDILFPETAWEHEWLTPKPEDSYLLTNMLRHAAVGINVASTVSLELCMFNKPVINVGYEPPNFTFQPDHFDYRRYYSFEHYRPLVESGAVALAGSEDEMRKMIRQSLTEPELCGFQRRALLKTMFGEMLDGQAGARVAACLLSLSKKSNQR